MSDYNKLFDNLKKLHYINFNSETGLIKLSNYNQIAEDISVNSKDYYVLEKESFKKKEIVGACHLCENEKFNFPDEDKCNQEKDGEKYRDYKLCYVSHGSHSIDYLRASGLNDDEILGEFCKSKWNDTPVLFLMENPSKDYDGYIRTEDVYEKYPTKTWYWVFRTRDSISDTQNNGDEYLRQGYYGDMIYSLICNNRLANAYITNAVKCGLNKRWTDKEGKPQDAYLGTWWYQDGCKRICAEQILAKEIETLVGGKDIIIIFAFGNNAYYFAKDFIQNSDNQIIKNISKKQLVLLPHPSSRINNQFRKVILKSYVKDVLSDNTIGCFDNIPEFDDYKKEQLVKILTDSGINCRSGNRDFNKGIASVKAQKEKSVFSEEKYTKNISLKTTNNMAYCYTFDDASFWVYDGNKKEYIDDYENDKVFITFEKAIKEIL